MQKTYFSVYVIKDGTPWPCLTIKKGSELGDVIVALVSDEEIFIH